MAKGGFFTGGWHLDEVFRDQLQADYKRWAKEQGISYSKMFEELLRAGHEKLAEKYDKD